MTLPVFAYPCRRCRDIHRFERSVSTGFLNKHGHALCPRCTAIYETVKADHEARLLIWLGVCLGCLLVDGSEIVTAMCKFPDVSDPVAIVKSAIAGRRLSHGESCWLETPE